MEQKKYTIDGKEYSLAICTPKRLASYCELIGMKDFSEMQEDDAKRVMKIRMLNIGLDTVKISRGLEICLAETYEGNLENINLCIVDEIIMDFFLQRLQN